MAFPDFYLNRVKKTAIQTKSVVEWKAFFKNPPIFIIDEATNKKKFFLHGG